MKRIVIELVLFVSLSVVLLFVISQNGGNENSNGIRIYNWSYSAGQSNEKGVKIVNYTAYITNENENKITIIDAAIFRYK